MFSNILLFVFFFHKKMTKYSYLKIFSKYSRASSPTKYSPSFFSRCSLRLTIHHPRRSPATIRANTRRLFTKQKRKKNYSRSEAAVQTRGTIHRHEGPMAIFAGFNCVSLPPPGHPTVSNWWHSRVSAITSRRLCGSREWRLCAYMSRE